MESNNILSNIQTKFESDNIILGIDEAGRGPALGPMVYACAYWNKDIESDIIKYYKFDDSKKLKPEIRAKLFEAIKQHSNIIKYDTVIIPANEISQKMMKRQKISLNQIAFNAAGQLILNALNQNVNIMEIYVDTIGPEKTYENALYSYINQAKTKIKPKITVAKKADAKYKIVSAASIVAKVTRDDIVDNVKYIEKDIEFGKCTGSGYPSDPYTVNWLDDNYNNVFGFPSFVRFSWKTIDNIFKVKGDNCLWENYDEEAEKKRIDYKRDLRYFSKKENNQNIDIMLQSYNKTKENNTNNNNNSTDHNIKSNSEIIKYENYYDKHKINFDCSEY